jgi:hypothetical protein
MAGNRGGNCALFLHVTCAEHPAHLDSSIATSLRDMGPVANIDVDDRSSQIVNPFTASIYDDPPPKCSVCKDLDVWRQRGNFMGLSLDTSDKFVDSALRGCVHCELLLLGVRQFPQLWKEVLDTSHRKVLFNIRVNSFGPLELVLTIREKPPTSTDDSVLESLGQVALDFYTLKGIS